ncbi:hypothetical protein M408DRAFT_197267 [Serendipita vermifera MAFF 305830]|uniref:Kazal-like domain-containing protein n=1 Tax=Serendipita vermifera MAFF 305830 TaxID=933852 RepID=A0A0C3B3Z0_SERVB|nr:hypothetical protein M408DRAFT_197267 [Serendipita vermifera MAFF 305830]
MSLWLFNESCLCLWISIIYLVLPGCSLLQCIDYPVTVDSCNVVQIQRNDCIARYIQYETF